MNSVSRVFTFASLSLLFGYASAGSDEMQIVTKNPDKDVVKTDWVYWDGPDCGTSDPYMGELATEAELWDCIRARYQAANPVCSKFAYQSNPDWGNPTSNYAGLPRRETKTRLVKTSFWAGPEEGCEDSNGLSGVTATRDRDVTCPYPGYSAKPVEIGKCESDHVEVIKGPVLSKPQCPEGNPCDPATGDKFQIEADYEGPILPFRRAYHSVAQQSQAGLGYGWTHTYSATIVLGGDSPAKPSGWMRWDGVLEPLSEVAAGSGIYVSRSGTGVQVRNTASGEWTLYRPDGSREVYEEIGPNYYRTSRLSQLVSVEGNTTDLFYNPDGQLESVTSPFGHQIVFSYYMLPDEDIQLKIAIQSVTFPNGSVATYGYGDNEGNLTAVTFAGIGTRVYEYTDVSFPHALTAIVDENMGSFATFTYDSKGRVYTSEHVGGKEKVTLIYDEINNKTTVTDADGYQREYNFSSQSNIFSWEADGVNFDSFEDALAGVRAADPDAQFAIPDRIHRLIKGNGSDQYRKVTSFGHAGATRITDYDDTDYARRVDSVTDENNVVTKYEYDTYRLTRVLENYDDVSDTAERVTEYKNFLNDTSNLPQLVEYPSVDGTNVTTTAISYHSGTNVPASITYTGYDSSGTALTPRVTTYSSLDAFGNVTIIDGPRAGASDVTTLAYYQPTDPECVSGAGACGQIKSITNALGHVVLFNEYFIGGQLKKMTDERGVVHDYTYDAKGRLDAVVQTPLSGSTRTLNYDYDAVGQIDQVSFHNGLVLNYEWTNAHLLDSIQDNSGSRIKYDYDMRGNLTDVDYQDASYVVRRAAEMAHDARKNLESVQTGSSGIDSRLEFDALGNLKSVKDDYGNSGSPVERTSSTLFDGLNRPFSTNDVEGLLAEYGFDIHDNMTSIELPKDGTDRVETRYDYDDFGNLLKEESPDRGDTLYAYDEAGNLVCRLDGRHSSGITDCSTAAGRVEFVYDAINRLTYIDYEADSSKDVEFEYDTWAKPGDLTFIRRKNRSDYIWSLFNDFGQLKGQWDYIDNGGGGVESLQTIYGYDASTYELQTITYPKPHPSETSGRVVTYERDAQGRIVGITASFRGTSYTIIDNSGSGDGAEYEPFGPVKRVRFGNGTEQEYQWDDGYRIDRIRVFNAASNVILNWNYTLDEAGNVQSIHKQGVQKSFTYDIKDRLLQDGEGGFTYSYDGNGNVDASALSLVYETTPEHSNRIAAKGGNPVIYDGMGNMEDDGGNVTFEYDAAGRMIELERAGGQVVVNQYNGKGERSFTHRTMSPTERYVEYYTYAEDGRLLTYVQSVQNPDDSLGIRTVYNYIWLDSIPVAQFQEQYQSDGTHIASQLIYIHADHLHTPRIATGTSEVLPGVFEDDVIVWSIWSSAYGYAFANGNPDGDSELVSLALRFPGQVYYGIGHYNYNYYRDYDPQTGRYMESDPIGLRGGPNSYLYGLGNPLRFDDPLGLDSNQCLRYLGDSGNYMDCLMRDAFEPVVEDVTQTAKAAFCAAECYAVGEVQSEAVDLFFACKTIAKVGARALPWVQASLLAATGECIADCMLGEKESTLLNLE